MKKFNITAQELSVETHGLSFLCAFGTHINGGWCAILNYGVSCELSDYPNSTESNAAAIANALANSPSEMRAWLPKGNKARMEIAMELSKIITENICL